MLRYFEFSDKGGDFDSPRCMGRIYLRGTRPWEIGRRGQRITSWYHRNVVRLIDASPLQDMPWIIGYVQVISDRLRLFLEATAPDCVQYLPLRAFHGREELPLYNYWVANWLPVVDCIDWRLSKVWSKGAKAKLIWPRIIDLNRTHGVPLLIVKEQHGLLLIRSDLKEMLQREGITGCQYGTIEQHD